MTLDKLPLGNKARVLSVQGGDAIARRLGELGLREGIAVEVLRRSPFGDPMVFELCGYQLCLRKSEAARVEIKTMVPDASGNGAA